MLKLGIFGGTFDPVHNEHLKMAKAFVEELKLDKLFVVPTYLPPHKTDKKVTDALCRKEMLEKAFSGEDKIIICDYEIKKADKSYTYETVKYFKDIYPDSQLYFLVGSDMLINFPLWKEPYKILECVKLVLCRRENQIENLKGFLNDFENKFSTKVKVLDYKGSDLSSGKVRYKIKLGLDYSSDLPKKVYEYIKNNNLYADPLCEYIRSVLSEKRYNHTINVCRLAVKYASKMNVNEDKAFYAALLHDNAKYKSLEDYPEFSLNEKVPEPVIHQFLGAYIAQNILKIHDEEIIGAIKYHTSGKADMTAIEKLIFTCDMLEESRTFKGVERLRLIMDKDFERCFRECVKNEMKHLEADGKPIYHKTVEAYEYYILREN